MFEFSAGCPALCLVDTVGNRAGVEIERLRRPEDLTEWLRQASLVDADARQATEAELLDARALRDAIYRAVLALGADQSPGRADIDLINTRAMQPPPRPQWLEGRMVDVADDDIRAAIASLAANGVAVLAEAKAGRVRSCPECRMMFVDRSPSGKRRWCASASGCGNRAKVREHRARKSDSGKTE